MSKTVVVIDDSMFLQKQVVDFFEKQLGLQVLGTGNDGNEAVELYKKYKPDLITLDITMPNKGGIDAIGEIVAEFPDANILMISAVRGNAMLECMSAGAKGYIEKPLMLANSEFVNDFKETINKIINDK